MFRLVQTCQNLSKSNASKCQDISWVLETCSNLFRLVQTCPNPMSGNVRIFWALETCSDLSRLVQTCSNPMSGNQYFSWFFKISKELSGFFEISRNVSNWDRSFRYICAKQHRNIGQQHLWFPIMITGTGPVPERGYFLMVFNGEIAPSYRRILHFLSHSYVPH